LSVVLVSMPYFKWEQYKRAVKLLLRTWQLLLLSQLLGLWEQCCC